MSRLFALLLSVALCAPALARNVFFVDNARAGGMGTYDKPFATIAEASARAAMGDVIYVGEGNAPYDGGITLRQGQMLIGAAYGLDAVRVELKTELNGPPLPAVQGSGPTIRGGIVVTGENVVAGCTIDSAGGSGISAFAPNGPVAIRQTWFRASKDGAALVLQNCTLPVTVRGGGVTAQGAFGVLVDGGNGEIAFERFPLGGSFVTAVRVANRTGGSIAFRNGSKITVDDARHDALIVQNSGGTVAFDDPLRVTVHGARGLVVAHSDRVVVAGGSRLTATNGTALDVRDATLDASFDSVSANGDRLSEGVVLDKVRGKVAVAGGAIENAALYGIRVEQSSGVQLAAMTIRGSGREHSLYLRHVRNATISAIDIRGGGGVAARNVENVAFDRLTVAGASKTALAIDEAIGEVPCTLCTIRNPDGAALTIGQHFNAARIVLDHLTVSAAERPGAAPALVDVRVDGGARLELDLRAVQLSDTAGAAMTVDAAGACALDLSIDDSFGARLGGAFVALTSHQSARVAFAMRGTRVFAPGSGSAPVEIAAGSESGDSTNVCLELIGNELTSRGSVAGVRIAGAAHSRVAIVAPRPPDVEIGPGTAVDDVGKCR